MHLHVKNEPLVYYYMIFNFYLFQYIYLLFAFFDSGFVNFLLFFDVQVRSRGPCFGKQSPKGGWGDQKRGFLGGPPGGWGGCPKTPKKGDFAPECAP